MEKRQIVLPNNEVIHYLEKGQGDQTLLLIHGNFSSGLYFTPLLSRMPKDIRILAPDLRGFGDSSYHERITSMADFVSDLVMFLKVKQIEKVTVLGWSLGGGVALEMAARHPEMVEKLILINSTTYRGYPLYKKDENGQIREGDVYASPEEIGNDPIQVKPLLDAQRDKNFPVMSYIFDVSIYTVNKPTMEETRIWIEESLKQRNLIDANWALATLNMSGEHNGYTAGTNTISTLKMPVLHTWGKQDIVVPEAMVMDNVKALKDNSTLVVYDQCGHSPFVDVPDALTKDIVTFMQS